MTPQTHCKKSSKRDEWLLFSSGLFTVAMCIITVLATS